jgi:mannosyltransferase OCH1-like enzyme
MEKDFINCMLFVTFAIIIVFVLINLFMTSPKIPFHIERTVTMKIEDKDIVPTDLSFNGVPAIIFQSYNNKLSNNLVNNISKNISNNNEFEFYLFNSADARLFIETNFDPKLLDIYDSLSPKKKNSLWKFCILYIYGGVYMDINLSLNIKVLDIFTNIMLSIPQNNNIIFTSNNNLISNKLIIAPPRLPIFKEIIDSYQNNTIVSLSNLINKYNYHDNIKLYIDNNYIKNIDTDEIYLTIN